jgi:hypothetical protein
MKVIDLRCGNGHGFEGWFGSEDDFLQQNGRGLVECPLCADRTVTRLPSAPRLNLSGARAPAPAPQAPAAQPQAADLHALWMQAVRHLMAQTEDVGDRFAEEARRIHYGETPQRGIRGQTTPDERESLADEGIEVVSIPVPHALKGPVQ